MVSPNCFTNFFHKFFSLWAVEKENKLLIGPKQFFLSLPVEKEIILNTYSIEKSVDSEFKIGETISRIRCLSLFSAVLQDRMPEYFENAAEVYHGDSEVKRFRMKNAYKLPVSDKVLKIVRANFTHEIEFYEFCKQRLQKQFDEIPVLP